ADAAALINADIRRSIESHRKTLMRRAAPAVSLTSHKPVKHFNVINGAGHTSATVSTPRPLSILDFDTEPLSILALLWDQKRIDTFAREAAMEAGAREGGPSVSELRTTAERLADELEVMHIERAEAKEALSSLVEVALSPLVENAFLARKPQAAENVPN
ncbi:MAG: hypothetical protein PHG21_03770, partial [Azoarcus sp.]|nr:hypothetical protein [Azoarcus sp.]